MRQINQLSQVLAKVVAAVVGLKVQGQSQEAIQITNYALNEHLELDLETLLEMEADQMIRILKEKPGMNNENIEEIADLFFNLGSIMSEEEHSEINSIAFYKRALKIYKHIELEENVYSIDRNYKIQEIEQLLN